MGKTEKTKSILIEIVKWAGWLITVLQNTIETLTN